MIREVFLGSRDSIEGRLESNHVRFITKKDFCPPIHSAISSKHHYSRGRERIRQPVWKHRVGGEGNIRHIVHKAFIFAETIPHHTKAMTTSRHPTKNIQRNHVLVANEHGIGNTARWDSSKRLKSLVALMVALQTPTMASTTSPPNYPPRSDSILSDAPEHSSTNYPKRPHKSNHFHSSDYIPSSSPILYLSDDEEEKRVLSALAKVEDGETTNSWTVDGKDDGDDDDDDNDSTSGSNYNHNTEEDEDAFLAKLRRFKRTLRQTSRSVDLTVPVVDSGDEDDKQEMQRSAANNQQESEEEEPQPLPNKSQSKQEDTLPGSKSNVRWRLSKLEAAISRQSLDSYASPSVLPNRPNARPVAGAQSPSIPARSFAVRPQTAPLRSATRQPQDIPMQHPGPAPAAKSHKPRTSVMPSLSANNIRQQSTVLQQRTTDPPPTSPGRSSSLTADNDVSPWVRRFLSTRPKDCLMLVPRDYLMDNFNLARLPPVVEHLATMKQKEMEAPSPNIEQRASRGMSQQLHQRPTEDPQHQQKNAYPVYRQALDLILRQEDDKTIEKPTPLVQYAAEVLYCLVHARFVVSPRGLDTIRSRMIIHGSHRINQPLFGRCPRLRCGGMPLLPCGLSEDYDPDGPPGNATSQAKRYCCHCRETFHFWESKVQGCAWAGMSLCHLLLLVYGTEELFPSHFVTSEGALMHHANALESSVIPHESEEKQEPGRIFGFPIHPLAQSW